MNSFDVPILSYEDIRKKADSFLEKYHSAMSIPVPIEEIVEFSLGIDIVPTPGLRAAFEIDGYISSDLTCITVDEYVYKHYENRYRYTLGHEIGHYFIHGDIFRSLDIRTFDEWKEIITCLPEKDYFFLEFHAYSFAGLILVPTINLKEKYETHYKVIRSSEFPVEEYPLIARQYIINKLAIDFEVSTMVIEKRIGKEDFWKVFFP